MSFVVWILVTSCENQQFTGWEKAFYTQAFDSLAESLSWDGFGRYVIWFTLCKTWQNVSIDCGELAISVSADCWSPTKYFDGLPNSSFERVPLPPLLTPLFLESHSKRTSRLHNIEIITAFALNFHISRFPGSRIFEVDQISGGSGPSDKGGGGGRWGMAGHPDPEIR